MKSTKQDQETKARLGAIGELNVVSMLMQRGWDSFNANVTIKNYKSVDIVCLKQIDRDDVRSNAFLPQLALVQVKTTTGTNIPVGLTLEQSIDKEYLDKMVMGPYVKESQIRQRQSIRLSSTRLTEFPARTVGIIYGNLDNPLSPEYFA